MVRPNRRNARAREVGPHPREKREETWGRLATDLDLAKLNNMTSRRALTTRAVGLVRFGLP